MQVDLLRLYRAGDATIGEIHVDDVFTCFSLEDVVRDEKIPGVTAIPAGTYKLILSWSPRFQRRLPLLVDVPNFDGVRIHPGNTAADTEGCILVGTQVMGASVVNSRAAFDALFHKLEVASTRNEAISINVRNEQKA